MTINGLMQEINEGGSVAGMNGICLSSTEQTEIYTTLCDPRKPCGPVEICNAIRASFHLGIGRAAKTECQRPMTEEQRAAFDLICGMSASELRTATNILKAMRQ